MRAPPFRSLPLAARIAGGVAALIALLLLLALVTMPIGWLRGTAERALSLGTGQTVRIGAIARRDHFSLVPRITVTDLRVAQPAWAGPGEMISIRSATVRLPLLPLLRGAAHPRDLELDGVRLALVHDAGKRANWEGDGSGGAAPDFGTVAIRDMRVTLDDRRRTLTLAGTVAADAGGVRVDARGLHRDRPATLAFRAPRIAGNAAWPFRAAFASPLAQLRLDVVAERPLDFAHFAGRASAAGSDLNRIDDLILAGLPGTQPVRLAGTVRHAERAWHLTSLRGTIGASDVSGRISTDKQDERNVVDGRLVSRTFSFDDLASDKDKAESAARRRALGERVIPDTRIDLAKLADTDGRLVVEAARLRAEGGSAFRSLAATLTLDRSRLVVTPLAIGLAHGRLEGAATVDQRGGTPPLLTLKLALVGSRLEDFVTGNRVTGPLNGRIALAGRGRRLRAALAQADGSVTFTARGGSVERAAAELLGRNAGAAFGALLGDGAERTPLHCLGVRMAARRGLLSPGTFALDTGVMRADGRGWVRLADERVALTLDGRSKSPGLARLPAPIEVGGTLAQPTLETADAGIGSARTIFATIGKAIGRLVSGEREAPAPDMDCGALMARLR